jgi:hypothetical protein
MNRHIERALAAHLPAIRAMAPCCRPGELLWLVTDAEPALTRVRLPDVMRTLYRFGVTVPNEPSLFILAGSDWHPVRALVRLGAVLGTTLGAPSTVRNHTTFRTD